MVGLAAQHVPHHALGLVAGDGHAHARGIARGQSLDGHIVVHVCFLSQPLTGCVQKPQFLRRVGGKCLQPGALRGQARIERRAVVIQAQQLADARDILLLPDRLIGSISEGVSSPFWS